MHHGAHNTASARKCVQVCAHWRLFRRMHVSRRKLPNMHMQTRIHTHARTHTCKHARTCTRAPARARMHVRAGSITTVTARALRGNRRGAMRAAFVSEECPYCIALHPQRRVLAYPAEYAGVSPGGSYYRACLAMGSTSAAELHVLAPHLARIDRYSAVRTRRTLINGLSCKRCDGSARL
jgi:hypothetical protein